MTDNNEYFLNNKYTDNCADNFVGEDDVTYHYYDGFPFAYYNGQIYVGMEGDTHFDVAKLVMHDEFRENYVDRCNKIEHAQAVLQNEIDELEQAIEEAESNDGDTSDLESELDDKQDKMRDIEDTLYTLNQKYEDEYYFFESVDYDEINDYSCMLEDAGRFWQIWEGENKGKYLVTFWSTPSVSKLYTIINDLNEWAYNNRSQPSFEQGFIAVGGSSAATYGIGRVTKATFIPVKQYGQFVAQANREYNGETEETQALKQNIQQAKELHLMNSRDKRNSPQMQNFIKSRNKVWGNKLAMHDANGNYKGEMPMAKWNAMRYQESKQHDLISKVLNESINNSFGMVMHPKQKNIIRMTESDLVNIVKQCLFESVRHASKNIDTEGNIL